MTSETLKFATINPHRLSEVDVVKTKKATSLFDKKKKKPAEYVMAVGAEENYVDDDLKYYRETNYGSISRKQAGMIYRAYKENELPGIGENQISWLYNRMAGSGMPTTNTTDKQIAGQMLGVVDAVAAKDYSAATRIFNKALDSYYNAYNDMIYKDDRPKAR